MLHITSDIGYIRQNQQVNFQFDAFNYRDWGNGSRECKSNIE